MTECDLNPTDHAILNRLHKGRASPAYIARKEDYSAPNVTTRLSRLVEHGYVARVSRGLYELVEDPRDARTTDVAPWRHEKTLRYLYTEKGYSQKEIADLLGCYKPTIVEWMQIHNIETRTNLKFSPDELEKARAALPERGT
ncbi:MarR family transcriptional regulator [Haladaptatus salinisoli]|uniref:MarR family transcriptional regulator n=1 Tax=Haladaptatus salinisoli TaxID=2884876 RepID=UPI001D0AFE14|nr:helix-turn-helix domain-containing protein [Haladaptatus salinisoli]